MLKLGIEPSYVLDRMETYEMRALLDYSHLKSQEDWERTRFEAFVSANCAGARLKKLEELVKFPWEKEKQAEESAEEREAHIKALAAKAKWMEENFLSL